MIVATTSVECPKHTTVLARFRAWWAARPTRKQRQGTVDLRHTSEAFQRDIGLENLLMRERRW